MTIFKMQELLKKGYRRLVETENFHSDKIVQWARNQNIEILDFNKSTMSASDYEEAQDLYAAGAATVAKMTLFKHLPIINFDTIDEVDNLVFIDTESLRTDFHLDEDEIHFVILHEVGHIVNAVSDTQLASEYVADKYAINTLKRIKGWDNSQALQFYCKVLIKLHGIFPDDTGEIPQERFSSFDGEYGHRLKFLKKHMTDDYFIEYVREVRSLHACQKISSPSSVVEVLRTKAKEEGNRISLSEL